MWFHVAVLQLVLESLDFIRLLGIKASSEVPGDTSLTSAGRRTRMVCQEQVLRLYLGKGCEDIAHHCKAKAAPPHQSLAGSFCLIQPKLTDTVLLLH